MHDTTAIIAPQTCRRRPAVGKNSNPRYSELYRHYPTIDYLRRGARRRLPHFAFEYGDGGSGKDDAGIKRNWTALDAVELVPRYGIVPSLPPCDVELFGRRYAAPIGIAPMGGPAIVWPGADKHLARAAQRARVPYVLGMAGGATIEEIAEIAPDVCWFQLYRAANNDHAIGFDLAAARGRDRLQCADPDARRAGAHDAGARSRGRPRRRVPARSEDAGADGDVAGLEHGAVAERHSALSPVSAAMPAPIPRSTRSSPSPSGKWAAPSPGRRSPNIATAGRRRSSSRAFCIRKTPRKRSRSASTACLFQITAAARSRLCRRRSTRCRRSSSKSATAPP